MSWLQLLLVETAAWKGEQACRVDRPGGHPEPEESLKLVGPGQRLATLPPQLVRWLAVLSLP